MLAVFADHWNRGMDVPTHTQGSESGREEEGLLGLGWRRPFPHDLSLSELPFKSELVLAAWAVEFTPD